MVMSETSSNSFDVVEKRTHHKSSTKREKQTKRKKAKKNKRSTAKRREICEENGTSAKVEKTSSSTTNAFGSHESALQCPSQWMRREVDHPTSESTVFGPVLPTKLENRVAEINGGGIYGAAELPQSSENHSSSYRNESRMYGPILPSPNEGNRLGETNAFDTYGPMPPAVFDDELLPQAMSAAQIELEERALQLKLAAIDGRDMEKAKEKSREEWMLELPEVGLKQGIASLANIKRTFHQGREKPDFNDRSAWTKTPKDASSKEALKSVTTTECLRKSAKERHEREQNREQERIARKLKKKLKRDESLLQIHQKKLRKREAADKGSKQERRPFSRDIDLKLSKIDQFQTKSIVDKAKLLDSKFASGNSKYL